MRLHLRRAAVARLAGEAAVGERPLHGPAGSLPQSVLLARHRVGMPWGVHPLETLATEESLLMAAVSPTGGAAAGAGEPVVRGASLLPVVDPGDAGL